MSVLCRPLEDTDGADKNICKNQASSKSFIKLIPDAQTKQYLIYFNFGLTDF